MTPDELVRVPPKRDDSQPTAVTPEFWRSLYKTETYVPTAMGRNGLAIMGLQNDCTSQADLLKFMTKYHKDAKASSFMVIPVNGCGDDPRSLPRRPA